MSGVVVDTDVFSFFFKRDSRSKLYEPHLRGQMLHLAHLPQFALDNFFQGR